MAVDIDIKAGSTWRRDKNGDRATRVAIISGVTGNIDTLLKNALDDASMPNYGDAHPADSTITLQNITVTPLGGGRYRAAMEYFKDPSSASGSSNATANVSATTVNEVATSDKNGAAMESEYTVTNSIYSWSVINPTFEADIEVPRITIDFEYVTSTYPLAEINQYLGRINSADWNGYAPRKILCSAIQVNQNGNEYRVRFSFTHEDDTFDFIAKVPDAPGNIVSSTDTDLDINTGLKSFDVYETVDFTPLGFALDGIYAVMSGTVISAATTETNITSGGKTIILTLTSDTWVASGATFDAQRQNILDGLVANGSEANGWNAQNFAVTDVVRTSDTVVTITLSAEATYNITAPETVRVTVPASALVTSSIPLFVSQSFTIDTV